MLLDSRLRAEGGAGTNEIVGESTGADRKVNTLGRGALQRSHDAALEPFAQLGDARCSVGAAPLEVEAAELVAGQTAKGKAGVSTGADTKANTLGRRRT